MDPASCAASASLALRAEEGRVGCEPLPRRVSRRAMASGADTSAAFSCVFHRLVSCCNKMTVRKEKGQESEVGPVHTEQQH